MSSETLTNDDWNATVERLGGSELLEKEARETGAFQRARKVPRAVDQLRLTLAYCLGAMGYLWPTKIFEGIGSQRLAINWTKCVDLIVRIAAKRRAPPTSD